MNNYYNQFYGIEPFCALGIGDCGSTSNTATNVTNNQKIINDTQLTTIKSNTYKNIMNNVNKDASTCSASTGQSQNVDLDFGDIEGTVNVGGVSQSQTAKLNFSCVNTAKICKFNGTRRCN